ncbi:ADP-ribose glycohydrolase OARD1 [Pimephales promelas]|uniref:ADP-ribose glycohydrolase OARD1 n=1 Tax=Pimephales promelas TaxID=90988 RepID=UPI001955C722|nr:ADP-ribose glycohydrolase OARD1 [Pimephales promelas]KAG1961902.1 ADP-ribose glycohydrolase OARD1 [Pimephales promelas]KAG1961903.1 ADP-ribose glycohydrolase OARD1 [Pimephales promelas]KAG1961904.1 ADP-ribose glycohydrolase OARD1 [Pimephales promelas]KAG1961906.1 ADP-ribose glycohydrolase OARD1 [Pimephales promelas]
MDKIVKMKLPCRSGWKLLHVRGDLFTCPSTDALAHCISEDCRMGAGIAVLFKKHFHGEEELLAQKKQPGQCAVLKRSDRFVYYLITKEKYNQKPTYDSLRKSLVSMREHCLFNGVNSISMPRIGCGLDKLKWENVSSIITEVFQDTNISITVYSI